MNEQQWRAQVVDLASWLGWRAYYIENATREIVRRSGTRVRVRTVNVAGVGWPDLVLVRRGRIIFAELKRDPERGHHWPITPEQEQWLAELRTIAVGIAALERAANDGLKLGVMTVHVWKPSDIERVKEALA